MSNTLTASVLFERMVSRLRLRHLRLLVAIDECRTLGSAATEVNMSQPAATLMVKELEELLDVRLYERHSRGMRPTESARLLAERARLMLGSVRQVAEEMAALACGQDQTVHVGAVTSAIHGVVEPRFGRLLAALSARLVVVEERVQQLLPLLHSGNIQVALVREPEEKPVSQFSFTPLLKDRLTIVASPQMPWHANPTRLRELASFHWTTAPSTMAAGKAFERACVEEGFTARRSHFQGMAVGLLCKVVLEGNALAALPWSLASTFVQRGELREIRLVRDIPLPALGAMHRSEGLSLQCVKLLQLLAEPVDSEP